MQRNFYTSHVPLPPLNRHKKQNSVPEPQLRHRVEDFRSGSVSLYANYNISFSPNERIYPEVSYGHSAKFSKGYDPKYTKKEFSFASHKRRFCKAEVLKQKLEKTRQKLYQFQLDGERRTRFTRQMKDDFGVRVSHGEILTSSQESLLMKIKGQVKEKKENGAASIIQKSWDLKSKSMKMRQRAELEASKAALIQNWWSVKVKDRLKKVRDYKAKLRAVVFIQAYYRFSKFKQEKLFAHFKQKLNDNLRELDEKIFIEKSRAVAMIIRCWRRFKQRQREKADLEEANAVGPLETTVNKPSRSFSFFKQMNSSEVLRNALRRKTVGRG
mmetsp:Transcript_1899/g.4196  ORF Transcript_1899/g.4196 Transcript_1899/m.4196 type:complete len:327 (-) Transcript_1899:1334-2314(-)|eukprot:CAMPEP_0204897502 /NCGR_PEP_ID=MMETSP1397-20131031/777_1 /ASSEMBLY_ACC=CAM_ASM_000891 /TAXON_ID=49980 /ORGANISM="Climacostomum Climacostomum virens, Strain Stock W-24" /LENGTH=326 /DNA_ID=CAMNT_0052065267 /DNA_START=78 /DNA_END=1058 /DNA_ORIENTATION=-